MPCIEVLSHDGVNILTNDSVGSQREKQYFRVMTEDRGKLFFVSKAEYTKWCHRGRPYSEAKSGTKYNITLPHERKNNSEAGVPSFDDYAYEENEEDGEDGEDAEDAEDGEVS